MGNRANDPQCEIPAEVWVCDCGEEGTDPDNWNKKAGLCQKCCDEIREKMEREEPEPGDIYDRAVVEETVRHTRIRQLVCEDFGGGW